MPEWGAAPIPARLLRQGLKDMVRISDARMSGTSYGTVVLHVAPESAVGGPLALVRDGDEIELNVPNRTLTMRVTDEELNRRRAAWKPRPPHFTRGYGRLFLDHVLQANEGCDFDFLRGKRPCGSRTLPGLPTPDPAQGAWTDLRSSSPEAGTIRGGLQSSVRSVEPVPGGARIISSRIDGRRSRLAAGCVEAVTSGEVTRRSSRGASAGAGTETR